MIINIQNSDSRFSTGGLLAIENFHFSTLYISRVFIVINNKLTSQKNSFPLSPQNQAIHDTSSELLMMTNILKNNIWPKNRSITLELLNKTYKPSLIYLSFSWSQQCWITLIKINCKAVERQTINNCLETRDISFY